MFITSINLYLWVICSNTIYLLAPNPFLQTLEGDKIIYIYLKETNSLVPKLAYKDKFNIGYKLVNTKVVSTYNNIEETPF